MHRFTSVQSQCLAHGVAIEVVDDDAFATSFATARVRPNSHQVDAAVTALRTSARRRAILAYEVTLAMSIDAGLVLGQRRGVSAGQSAPCADVVLGGRSVA